MSNVKYYTLHRLKAFYKEIENLETSDFPYEHSEEALLQLKKETQKHISDVESVPDNAPMEVIEPPSVRSLNLLFGYTDCLGFILRSTNVRNAFETHGPLLRIARKLLGDETKLILSSEWEYSPVTYRFPILQDFVLIGAPAHESSNPLLIPLSGHELGHTIWVKKIAIEYYEKTLRDEIVNEIIADWETLRSKYNWKFSKGELNSDIEAIGFLDAAQVLSLRQAQESFCDFVGVRIFGVAYLHAFAYFLAPGIPGRNRTYPSNNDRASSIEQAANEYGLETPSDYSSQFAQDGPTLDPLLAVIDKARKQLIPELIARANEIISEANVRLPDTNKVAEIEDLYKKFIVPACDTMELTNIVNAAWNVFLDDRLWKDKEEVVDSFSVLSDLVLKNIEVLEIETRIAEAP